MITIQKARRILGKDAEKLTEAQLDTLLATFYALAEVTLKNLAQRQVPKSKEGS